MRHIALPLLCLLAACSSSAAEEERRYNQEAAKNRLDYDRWPKLCTKSKSLAQMYLSEGNTEKYGVWSAQADYNCRQKSSLLP